MTDLAAIWHEFWMIGMITLGAVVVVAAAVLVTRQRSRAKVRQPQYRRHTYWEYLRLGHPDEQRPPHDVGIDVRAEDGRRAARRKVDPLDVERAHREDVAMLAVSVGWRRPT